MLIAHLADLHLGYRAYHRLAPGGINLRERDVARAFRAALDRIIELQPQLVLVAGDVFHSVRPSNSAIADAFRQFARLSSALPAARIVVVAGDHDTPRSVESGSILRLFAEIPRITVMDQDAREVTFEELDVTVMGVPHAALLQNPLLKPRGESATNILVTHGAWNQETLQTLHDYGGALIDIADLYPELWHYVALGHYHIAAEIRPNVWYPGAIERTSNNLWREREPKGFLTFDTESRSATHQPLETRPVLDLRPIEQAREHSADGLNAELRKRVESIKGGIEDKIVRLVIFDLPRELGRELDHKFVRECKARALHFQLDARRPQSGHVVAGARGRSCTLEQELENFVRHTWHPSTKEIDRERVLELARRYLHLAGAAEAAEIGALGAES
ncbi:MAG: metallophosphoesterase family protein [Gemmatimonadota bacterium]